jgi:hypothetical protein
LEAKGGKRQASCTLLHGNRRPRPLGRVCGAKIA